MYPSSGTILSRDGDLSLDPTSTLRAGRRAIPRIGQNSGMSMSEILMRKGIPWRRARCLADSHIRYSGVFDFPCLFLVQVHPRIGFFLVVSLPGTMSRTVPHLHLHVHRVNPFGLRFFDTPRTSYAPNVIPEGSKHQRRLHPLDTPLSSRSGRTAFSVPHRHRHTHKVLPLSPLEVRPVNSHRPNFFPAGGGVRDTSSVRINYASASEVNISIALNGFC